MKTLNLIKTNVLACITILSLVLTTATLPKMGHAIVGGATGNAPLMTVGGLLVVGGVIAGQIIDTDGPLKNFKASLYSMAVAAFGLIVLDKNDQASVTFPEISADRATKAKLTTEEFAAYQNEREELTLISQSISSKLKKSPHASIEMSANLWKAHSQYVSEPAFNAAVKIVNYAHSLQ